MAANIFGRYIWLIDILRRHGRLTFEEINKLWTQSGLSYGEGDDLPLRTFHNHRKAIIDIFDIYIECDTKDGYRYYIDDPERLQGDGLRTWLIDSYATLNQIQADSKLKGRIIFEDAPSGNIWLTDIAQAMRTNHVIKITHQGFWKDYENTFDIEPYYLKIFNQRWYVLGRNPYYAKKKEEAEANGEEFNKPIYRVYGLDRVKNICITDKTFVMDRDFSIEEYFKGCCGIIPSNDEIVRVVFKAYYGEAKYLKTLKIHQSQDIVCEDDDSTTFKVDVKPTYDFYQKLLAKGDRIEVLSPDSVREEMRNFAKNMLNYYK